MVSRKRIETFLKLIENDKSLREHHYVDCGSSREVYELGDMVIKVPRGMFGARLCEVSDDEIFYDGKREVVRLGMLQTEKEIEVWETSSAAIRKILATVYCYGSYEGMPYIVMEKVDVSPEYAIIEEKRGMSQELLDKGFRIVKNHMRLLHRLMDRYQLLDADLFDCFCNCGMTKDKKLVLCDYGFCGWEEESYKFSF